MIFVKVLILVVCLIWTSKASASYDLSLMNLPSMVSPGGGSFSFDLYLSNPTQPYMGWSFYFLVQGQSGQNGVDFNTAGTATDSKNNLGYIFSGNSDDYQCAAVGGNTNSISCSDMTADFSTIDTGGLLANITVDYDATAVGNYDIIVGTSNFNFIIDDTFTQQSNGPAQGTLMGTFAVAPEPISSALFVVGGATLGIRRFWKKRSA